MEREIECVKGEIECIKSEIECVKRVYRIRTPSGMMMEVESKEKPISEVMTQKLLREDEEVHDFFDGCKRLKLVIHHRESISEEWSSPEKIHRKPDKKFKKLKNVEIRERHRKEPKNSKSDLNAGIKEFRDAMRLEPFERINVLLRMEGEFTRYDYQRFMEEGKQKMSNFMGHDDIRAAMLLGKIEAAGGKEGKGLRRYRVIDQSPIDKDEYRQAVKESKPPAVCMRN